MALIEPPAQLTPREHLQMEFEREMFDKRTTYELEAKKLELEVAAIEARWNSWFKLPATIIKLPIYCLLAISVIISSIRNQEVPKDIIDILKK